MSTTVMYTDATDEDLEMDNFFKNDEFATSEFFNAIMALELPEPDMDNLNDRLPQEKDISSEPNPKRPKVIMEYMKESASSPRVDKGSVLLTRTNVQQTRKMAEKKQTKIPKQELLLKSVASNATHLKKVPPPKVLHLLQIVSPLKETSDIISCTTVENSPKRKKVYQNNSSPRSLSVSDIQFTESEPLVLTAEEKRLLEKEGIVLPTHLPLTKKEESILKQVRRKIRNKISAQFSRKKKREYMDRLENKIEAVTKENTYLKDRVDHLEKENVLLKEQVSKLQSLFKLSTTKATPATCLMVVMVSAFLISLPNLNLPQHKELLTAEKEQVTTIRRALLASQTTEEDSVNMDDYLVFNKGNELSYDDKYIELMDIDNITENEFSKIIEDIDKRYYGYHDKNGSENVSLFRKLIHNVESFLKESDVFNIFSNNLGTGGSKRKIMEFIEPELDFDDAPPVQNRDGKSGVARSKIVILSNSKGRLI